MSEGQARANPNLTRSSLTNRHRVESFFQRLGDDLAAKLGEDRDSVYAQIERVATEQLEAVNPSAHVDCDDLVDYVLGADALCKQADLDGRFAEPPVSLYRGSHFDISALTWLDGTTSIHQHAFSGAFHVLAGSSIHSRYEFDPDQTPAPMQRAIAGQLRLLDIEILRPGDTRAIVRGSLIHSLFHMTRPSVTIVVRTITDDPETEVQYDYRWPGLAHDPFQRHAPTIRKLQYLRMLHRLDANVARTQLRRVLASADLFLAYMLISEHAQASVSANNNTQELAELCGALPADQRQLLHRATHNDLLSRSIVALREKLHNPGHRFFLALLLNVFNRQELLRLVQRQFEADDPAQLVMTWVAEMTGNTNRFGNLIGLNFNATELRMLSSMLAGAGITAVLEQFRELYGKDQVAAQSVTLRALYKALKHCALFKHIFSDLPE